MLIFRVSFSFQPLIISTTKIGDKKSVINERVKESIISYLTDNPEGKTKDFFGHIGLGVSRTRDYLRELVDEGIIVAEGASSKAKIYRLKS